MNDDGLVWLNLNLAKIKVVIIIITIIIIIIIIIKAIKSGQTLSRPLLISLTF
jgi:hypothetical protein